MNATTSGGGVEQSENRRFEPQDEIRVFRELKKSEKSFNEEKIQENEKQKDPR